jgi:hypothetical protein
MLTTADKFSYIWHKCWNYNTQAQSQTFIFIWNQSAHTLKWMFVYSSVDTKTVIFPKSLKIMYLYSDISSSNLLTSQNFLVSYLPMLYFYHPMQREKSRSSWTTEGSEF